MIKIFGLQKMTLIDYPGKVAAAIFLAGCNFHCGYCHNPDLVENKADSGNFSQEEVLNFLAKRKNLLDGVCVSGGEPLLNPDLGQFLKKIKDLGYPIKLDTNGLLFSALKQIIDQNLIDYVAMDIKASLKNYGLITGLQADFSNILKSIELIMSGGFDYEFRSTILPKFHNQAEIQAMAQMIKGAKIYYLQNFNNNNTLDPAFLAEKRFKAAELNQFKELAENYVQKCEIRN